MATVDSIRTLIAPSVEALGYELWGLELISAGKYTTVRVYIESSKGITVDDCAAVSHQISGVLDVEDPITSRYTLEVSSPGVDRLLFNKAQFEQYIGQFIRIRLHVPFENRRKFAGVLTGIEGDELVLLVDQSEYLLPLEAIDKAQLDTTVVVSTKS